MLIPVLQMEQEYKSRIESILRGKLPCPDLVLELSLELYNLIKAEGIINSRERSEDMLLFQYGLHQKHFILEITRQFMHPKKHEPEQLSFTLFYDPIDFIEINYHFTHRSMDSTDLDAFTNTIKSTKGFKTAKKFKPTAYTLTFSQS
jgi:hypothetical protein